MIHEQATPVATNPVFALSIPVATLQPLIESVLESSGCVPGWPMGRVALNEVEAAECIGVKTHVLRDARLRLTLPHTRIGRTITFTPTQLSQALEEMETNARVPVAVTTTSPIPDRHCNARKSCELKENE